MADIVCVAGLPGSGKTTLARLYSGLIENTVVVDDIKSLSQLENLGDGYSTIIITDPWFCDPDVRANANTYLLLRYDSVTWRFFDNNPDACRTNVANRNDGREVDNLITELSKIYKIPDNAVVLAVHIFNNPEISQEDQK